MQVRSVLAAALLMLLGGNLTAHAQALQCVPYAREESGIVLKGDAWTWWASASGQYDRGQTPRLGAVLVFKKHGSMSHGHVAVVANVVNSRKLMVDHANWAPSRGHGRGQVTRMVMVTDVSPHNDWTQVRVWNDNASEMGQKVYPTFGFIYARDRRPAEGAAVEVAALGGADQSETIAADMPLGAAAALTEMLAPPVITINFAIGESFSQ